MVRCVKVMVVVRVLEVESASLHDFGAEDWRVGDWEGVSRPASIAEYVFLLRADALRLRGSCLPQ